MRNGLLRCVAAVATFAFALVPSSCASGFSRAKINGVSFSSAIGREAVPGGTPYGFALESIGGTLHNLSIDDVPFGQVEVGDRVQVDKDGVVRVNGVIRQPRR